MALRPRLSPGVPLSRDGAADLGSGTRPVKHLLQARQLCRNQEVKFSVGAPLCFLRLLPRVHGAMSDRRVRRSWRRGSRLCPPRNSKWLGLQIRSCGGTPCASARASSFSAISHAGHHSVGGIPWYRCAYCGLRRTWRSPPLVSWLPHRPLRGGCGLSWPSCASGMPLLRPPEWGEAHDPAGLKPWHKRRGQCGLASSTLPFAHTPPSPLQPRPAWPSAGLRRGPLYEFVLSP